jgi:hypothetical protein
MQTPQAVRAVTNTVTRCVFVLTWSRFDLLLSLRTIAFVFLRDSKDRHNNRATPASTIVGLNISTLVVNAFSSKAAE